MEGYLALIKEQREENDKLKKHLQQKVEQLEKELQITANKCKQLENIRKEAIKYVQEKADYPISYYHCLNDLLNILNKGDNKE